MPSASRASFRRRCRSTRRSASSRTEAQTILPQGFTIDYAGESRQLRTEGSKFLGTFLLSAVLIYLVLAAQFESFRDPFIILAGSVPLAVSGRAALLVPRATTLNIYSQVGLITLVGLVSKNGILIVQFANELQQRGRDKLAAVIEAAATRLRPILMTTAATVVGHFPLVLATGPGAGARNSIGIMLVSGMVIGTVFTLFVVPSIYVLARALACGVTGSRCGRRDRGSRTGGGVMKNPVTIIDRDSLCCWPRRRARRARRIAAAADAARCPAADARRGGAARDRTQSRSGRRAARHRGARPRRSARAGPHTRRIFSTTVGAIEQRRAADQRTCSATSGVDHARLFSSTGVRQRVPWGNGTWSLSWDASRTTSNSPLNSFDPSRAVRAPDRVLAAAGPRPEDRRRRGSSDLIAKRNQQSSELQFREIGRPDRRGGQAGLLDAEGAARERHRAAAVARSWPSSWRARTASACGSARRRRSIWCRCDAEVADRRENLIRAARRPTMARIGCGG